MIKQGVFFLKEQDVFRNRGGSIC